MASKEDNNVFLRPCAPGRKPGGVGSPKGACTTDGYCGATDETGKGGASRDLATRCPGAKTATSPIGKRHATGNNQGAKAQRHRTAPMAKTMHELEPAPTRGVSRRGRRGAFPCCFPCCLASQRRMQQNPTESNFGNLGTGSFEWLAD